MPQEALFDAGPAVPQYGEPGYKDAMNAAGRLLARRAMSVAELRARLDVTHPEQADRVVERLLELRLLDDDDFAGRWVQERAGRRGGAALLSELEGKGVARDVAERAIAAAPDEEARAIELASAQLKKVVSKPLIRQAASIQSLLLRRGYSAEIAEAACKAVLPPEGWD